MKIDAIKDTVEPGYLSSSNQIEMNERETEYSVVTDYSQQNNSQQNNSQQNSSQQNNSQLENNVLDIDVIENDVVEIYLSQAQAYGDEREWEKAITACKEALAIAPQSGYAYKMLGTLYQRQNRLADAMGFYAKALSVQAHFPEVYSNLGSLYAQQQNWEKAIHYYQKAIAQSPKFAPAHLNLSKVWKQLGNDDEAQQCLLTALKINPELGTSQEHYQIAKSLDASDRKEEAITFYRQSLHREKAGKLPQDKRRTAAIYQRLADLLEEQGDWQAATECYHSVLDLGATRLSSKHLLPSSQAAISTSSTGAQSSLTSSTHARSTRPVSFQPARSQLVRPQLALNGTRPVPNLSGLSKADQARIHRLISASNRKKVILPTSKTKALVSGSSDFAVPSQRSLHSQTENQHSAQTNLTIWPKVIEQLRQAIKATPRSAVLYRNLAKALASNNQKQRAAEAWFRAFMLDPDWPSAAQYFELGKALENENNLKAAAYCYGHAIRQQPDLRAAQARLGQLAAKLRRSANAQTSGQNGHSASHSNGQKAIQEVVQKKETPTPPSAQTTRTRAFSQAQVEAANAAHKEGEALRKTENWQAAADAFKEAIRLYPNFSWSHHSLGDCYKKMEAWEAAADAYRQAISLNDEFVWSYYSLAEVLEAQESLAAAAESYRRARAIAPDNKQIPPRLAGVLRKLIDQSPRDVELYKALAEQLIVQGKLEDAISTYQMALQIEPTEASIALSLSELLSSRDPQQAHLLIDRALAETASTASAHSARSDTDFQYSLDAAVLRHTHLFDPIYYRAAHPSVAADVSTDEPQALLEHYLTQGSAAGYSPNPLFDDNFYRAQHPDIAQQQTNPLVHYYKSGYKSGADPHPFFSTAFYTQTHEDVAATNVNPLEHYLAYGAQEGRAAFSSKQFSNLLSSQTPNRATYTQPLWKQLFDESAIAAQTNQHIGVYCSSIGNYFITEIADFIAAALEQTGHRITRLDEQATVPDSLDAHWVIAPHEFFYLGDGSRWKQKQAWLSDAVMINVEQPQTTWFSKAFHFLRHAKVIFDINVKSAAILQQLSLPAYWLPLGYLKDYAPFSAGATLPKLRALGSLSPEIAQSLPELSAPLGDRPIDLHFIGTLNPRREKFIAQNARWLCKHHSFLHIPPMGVPLLKGQDQALDTETVIGLSRRSKILLNIHRDDLPYFEWHRMIFHGLWQNTLVVTEPCHDIPGLVAGEHFVACDLENMRDQLDWLLRSSVGRKFAEQVRSAGHKAFKTQFDGARIMANAAQIAHTALSKSRSNQRVAASVSRGQS